MNNKILCTVLPVYRLPQLTHIYTVSGELLFQTNTQLMTGVCVHDGIENIT